MENKSYKKILKNAGKTMTNIGKNTAIVSGVVTVGMSPFTLKHKHYNPIVDEDYEDYEE